MGLKSSFLIIGKLPQNHSVVYHGLPLVIEWPKGCVREGKDSSGKVWRREMKADYGYIDDTSGKGDTEPLDIYIGDDSKADKVFVIEQLGEDGEFDEYKLVTGVPDLESAQALYLAHYPEGWEKDRLGDVFEAAISDLKGAVKEHQEEEKVDKTATIGKKEIEMKAFLAGTEDDKLGTELTSFYGHGPATCMNCVHRTPHSKDEGGEEVDSCAHPLVKVDPQIDKDRKLPDGTIRVDADDWCEYAHAPEEGEGKVKEASGHAERNQVAWRIYMQALANMGQK